jgi:hypothetical protein
MSSTVSPKAIPSFTERAPGGRFATGNPGGPGNPFARQTAALRAYLINHVTERDLQDILDILLLNAKAGHLPSIKLLFAYVLGKPKSVAEPDLLDLQELQMLQQGAQASEALEELCDQLPLDFQVQLTRHAQAENAAAAVQPARGSHPAAPPSTDGVIGEPRGPAAVDAPSANGDFGAAAAVGGQELPSTNGNTQRPPPAPAFDWMNELRRALGGLSPP